MNKNVILFLHGGPGLSSSYFGKWFDSLKYKYDLYFYDQIYQDKGLGVMHTLYLQLLETVEKLKEKYTDIILYCHSWSNLILLKSVQYNKNILNYFKKIIFSNPSSICWEKFSEFSNKLFNRVPSDSLTQIEHIEDSVKLMYAVLPYYVGNVSNVPDLYFDKYDTSAYDLVEKELINFDFTQECSYLDSSICYSIYCENDIEKVDDSQSLANQTQMFLFKKAGHFPFAEYNDSYIQFLLKNILDN